MHLREIANIIFARLGCRVDHNSSEHLAHQKRKADSRTPQAVLFWVRGTIPQINSMNRAFRELRRQRVADRAGYVLVQNYYLHAERAASRQRVCLWLCDDTLRIDCRDELLASYPCLVDEEVGQIQSVAEPTLHDNRFAREQPRLLEIGPEQWQRLRHLDRMRRQSRVRRSQAQLPLPDFEIESTDQVVGK